MRGLFLTLEGGEGSGKSTQLKRLVRRIESVGVPVRALREPGGTEIGEAVRNILLDPQSGGMDARAELLLYEAARAQLVAEVIEPALAAGEVVICDRFFDSTTAYQGYARGLNLSEVTQLNLTATAGLVPDRTLVFDIDSMVGVERAVGTGDADRLEAEDAAFHERVRSGFLAIAAAEPRRVRVVDASGTADEVEQRVWAMVADLVGPLDGRGSV
ncbi:MAG: dTMP kinase [Actinobacteria bacterium HGW-Actinobacteria-7]|jgi:dTMP kinase|nr:MAG: dTMP kinase [Actinobacteria bacterium HGW-Actinobacteria-7]